MIRKRMLLLLILPIILLLVSCNKNNNNEEDEITTTKQIILNISLNNEIRGMTLNANFQNFNDVDNIKEFGLVYVINSDIKDEELTIETLNSKIKLATSKDVTVDISNFKTDDYEDIYTLRAFVVYENKANKELFIYSEQVNSISLKDLAYQDDESDFAKEIIEFYEPTDPEEPIEKIIIKVINATINNNIYLGNIDDHLKILIETDYKVVSVTISILDTNYLFDQEVELIINGNKVNNFIIDNELQVIVFYYDDPNWSGIH